MRIVLFGPPGVGKGTQARMLVERHGLAHISTGELLRAAIKADLPIGREARAYMDAGQLAPDHLARPLAEAAIAEAGYDDFILDGYPRTVVQAEWLEAFLDVREAPLEAVICLEVPDDVIIERLSQRRVHKLTGENYHLQFKPPPSDLDPAFIVQREDDRPEAIRKRLEHYREQTKPVAAFYQDRGIYFTVDGVGDVEDVHARIEALLRKKKTLDALLINLLGRWKYARMRRTVRSM